MKGKTILIGSVLLTVLTLIATAEMPLEDRQAIAGAVILWVLVILFGILVVALWVGFLASLIGGTLGTWTPSRHRWLSNGLKPRKMHWGPRRLF